MEKYFLPYDLSMEFKQLGFNEVCFGHWNPNNSEINYWFEEEIQNERTNKWFLDVENQFPKINKNGCSALLTSQSKEWLREKYKLLIVITEYNKDGSLIIQIYKDRFKIYDKMTNYEINEYQQAELEAIRECIKIIKNE